MASQTYTGVAATLDAALKTAHGKIPPKPDQDYTTSRVVSWGVQLGGFTEQTRFWVEVAPDDCPFKPDG